MNNNLLRRTEIKVFLDGKDITKKINNNLISFSYTDNEEDTADDLQLTLNDVNKKFSGKSKTKKNTPEDVVDGLNVGDIVDFTGDTHYLTSTSTNGVKTSPGKAKVTLFAKGAKHPYHLRAVNDDGKYVSGVYGWVDEKDIKQLSGGETTTTTTSVSSLNIKKYSEISATIIQKNINAKGKDRILDCGVFEIDSYECGGPPSTFTIKATSIPYKSKIRKVKKTKVFKNMKLKAIVRKIAKENNMDFFYDSSYNPKFKRKEQKNQSDLAFLRSLCKKAGIALKVSGKIIVLFDEKEYEKKKVVSKITYRSNNMKSYKFSKNTSDTAYSSCKVSYTNPKTKKTIEYTYEIDDSDADGEVLEVKDIKVDNLDEAKVLAKKMLRLKNKGEYLFDVSLVGNTKFVSGQTIRFEKFGIFDGKYIISKASHKVSSSGYVTTISGHKALGDY